MSTAVTTAEAATQAGVTAGTIRTWCRRGVVAAAKAAGRWVIDTTSLAHRIAIGAMRAKIRIAAGGSSVIDLSATYTIPEGPLEGHTVRLRVRRRTQADGTDHVVVRGLLPLFADRISAAADPLDRIAAWGALDQATIVYAEAPREFPTSLIGTRDGGRISTAYPGAHALSVDEVLDVAEQIRDQVLREAPGPRPARKPVPEICLERSSDWRAGRHHYVVTGPADVLLAAYEQKLPVTVTGGDCAGDRVYPGTTAAVHGDYGIVNQRVGLLSRKGETAIYAIDGRYLDEAPRLLGQIDRENAEQDALEARQRAADSAYLDNYYN